MVSGDDGDGLALQVQFLRESFGHSTISAAEVVRYHPADGLGPVLIRKDVSDAGHLFGSGGVERLDAGMRMRAGKELRIQHVGEPDAAGVLRFAREARDGDFGQRGQRLADDVQVFRRIALECADSVLVSEKGLGATCGRRKWKSRG